ncbi:NAC domain-containing protein 96 [Daucus carota subsp. sativus]|nr:PREDICTED: NAC domain-containing protein 83-like [Daucus carota subsp. sativus]
MSLYKFVMLMLYTMVPGRTNGNSANHLENEKVEVEVESKNLPPMPPGFHFVPSSAVLILEYLVKKIVGAPLASDLVKVRDGIQCLDPEEHRFEDDFAHCQDNHAYYITTKAQRKTKEDQEAGGGSKTSTIIKTTRGYWREKKKDMAIYNEDGQIIGYKTRYVFCCSKNDETSWRMDEFTVNPETIPANARDQIKETVACRIRVKQAKTPERPFFESEESEEEDEGSEIEE